MCCYSRSLCDESPLFLFPICLFSLFLSIISKCIKTICYKLVFPLGLSKKLCHCLPKTFKEKWKITCVSISNYVSSMFPLNLKIKICSFSCSLPHLFPINFPIVVHTCVLTSYPLSSCEVSYMVLIIGSHVP
jgi:hypothetical protein